MMPMRRALLIALLLPALAAAQYKWTDASGQVNYGDNPPLDARDIERVNAPPVDPSSPLSGLPYEVRRAAQQFPVTLYTTPSCAACAQARDMLRARGVPFAERTISSREEAEEARKLGVGDLVPALAVGRQWVREPDFALWNRVLDEAGYPRAAILPRGYQNPPPRALLEKAAPAPAAGGSAP